MLRSLVLSFVLGASTPSPAVDAGQIRTGRLDAAHYDYGRLLGDPATLSSLRAWAKKNQGLSSRPGRSWDKCGVNRQARYVLAWTSVGAKMSPSAYRTARSKVSGTLADLEVRAKAASEAASAGEVTAIGGKLAGIVAADQIWMGDALLQWAEPDEDTTSLFAAVLEARACDFEWVEAAELRHLLSQVSWPGISKYGAVASENAWLISQHVDHDPNLQKLALARLEIAVGKGEAKPEHFAYLSDRIAANAGRPQRFGTQLRCLEGKTAPKALADPGHVDDARKAYGMTPLADYLKAFDRPCKSLE